jgi:hypothetical protein
MKNPSAPGTVTEPLDRELEGCWDSNTDPEWYPCRSVIRMLFVSESIQRPPPSAPAVLLHMT